jgi:membrane peptidoglycan carboxypeptidase
MLRQVVLSGTGKRAQLDGYSSAGKTGTAWKFDPATKRVERSKYISSFVGFAPANDPKYVIIVVMDEPKSGARDGGSVSAPVFKDVAQQLLALARVPRDLTTVSNPAPLVNDVPEVITNEVPTVKGPIDDKEKSEPTQRNRDQKILGVTGNVKAEKTANKTALTTNSRPAKNGPAIWKSKPKT